MLLQLNECSPGLPVLSTMDPLDHCVNISDSFGEAFSQETKSQQKDSDQLKWPVCGSASKGPATLSFFFSFSSLLQRKKNNENQKNNNEK